MNSLKLKSTTLAVLIGALSSLSVSPSAVGQSGGDKDKPVIISTVRNLPLNEQINGKASIVEARLIAGPMWDYPAEGEFVPVVSRPVNIGGGWKLNTGLLDFTPYDVGLINSNYVTSPPLPAEKVAYARYNSRRLPTDIRGKVAGGRIPVINYRFARLINDYRCQLADSFEPRDWDKVQPLFRPQVVDPVLNVLGYELPSGFSTWCALQGALDAAVALVRFAPSLYSPKEYHESAELYKEAEEYAKNGLASSADAILQYRRPRIIPLRHFYNRKGSPLYFIVSAYPHMNRVVPTERYSPDKPVNFFVPRMTFYFFPVSPSGEVCYFQNAYTHELKQYIPYSNFDLVYFPAGFTTDRADALKVRGLTGVRCALLAHSWMDDYITVRVVFKDGRWQLDEELPYPIRPRVMFAPDPYRIYQEPFVWIGKYRYPSGWPVAPAIHPFDALIRFYPPFARWLEKIERGERHEVTDASCR